MKHGKPIGKSKHTAYTDDAIRRVHQALKGILEDKGTTGQEKAEILAEIAAEVETHRKNYVIA